jgi:hypothetical protein
MITLLLLVNLNSSNVVNDHTIVNLNSSNVVHDQIVVNCPNVVKHPTVVNCPYKWAECSNLSNCCKGSKCCDKI